MKDVESFVLCVEDDLDTQEMLGVLLQERGYRFKAVDNCSDALNLIREVKVSLLLLDNQLPDGAGVDLCEQVRRFDKNLPIIFLSGSAYESAREVALRAGANAFLTKPIELEALYRTLARWATVSADSV
jgi:CheY-like chemotaxis protein